MVLKYSREASETDKIKSLLNAFLQVNKIFIHSTPEEFLLYLNTEEKLIFTSQVIEIIGSHFTKHMC